MSSTPPPQENPEGMPRYRGPASPAAQRPTVAQPSSIRTAVRLMLVGAAISLISLIISFATMGALKTQIRDQLAQSSQNVTENLVNTSYSVAIGLGIAGGIIAILLWLWMAWKNGQGRRWARIVATVLGAINVISTLFTIFSGNQTTITAILAVINLILAVVILVLLWRKESSAYYAAGSTRTLQA